MERPAEDPFPVVAVVVASAVVGLIGITVARRWAEAGVSAALDWALPPYDPDDQNLGEA